MEARFVSRGPNYSTGVRAAEVEDYATGRQKVLVAHLEAQFTAAGVKDIDLDAALKARIPFPGLPHDRETEEHVSIRSRLGVWDSRVAKAAGMKDKDADTVIAALRVSDRYGLDFVEVLAAALTAPWPAYDDMPRRNTADIQKLVDRAVENGCDLNDVIAYEKENKASAKLLDLLNEALDTDPAEKPVVIHA